MKKDDYSTNTPLTEPTPVRAQHYLQALENRIHAFDGRPEAIEDSLEELRSLATVNEQAARLLDAYERAKEAERRTSYVEWPAARAAIANAKPGDRIVVRDEDGELLSVYSSGQTTSNMLHLLYDPPHDD